MLAPLTKEFAVPFDFHPALVERMNWWPIGVVVSAIPDVLYPWDPAVVKAIRKEFDPGLVPLMVKRVYRARSGAQRVYRFHALASLVLDKDYRPAPWTERVLKPICGPVPRVSLMNLHLEDGNKRPGDGRPGEYRPFTWELFYRLRSLWQDWSEKEIKAYKEEHGREAQTLRAVDSANLRTVLSWKENERQLRRRIQNILSEDPRVLAAALRRKRRAKAKRAFVEIRSDQRQVS